MELVDFAKEIARDAGALLMARADRVGPIHYKGALDLVTEADRQSEALIVGRIREVFPRHAVLAEESHAFGGTTPVRWIVDPLDGTTNFAHGFPCYTVSIGVEVEGEVRVGVVYDPTRDELFHAERGRGAFLNGSRLMVSGTDDLGRSLLVTGFPYDVRESRENNVEHFVNFLMRAQGIRRTGSAALDMGYVAAGRFDGFWELKLKAWDTAAGSLLVHEAGGKVTDFRGEPFKPGMPQLLATNGRIHQAMLEVLKLGTGEWVNG